MKHLFRFIFVPLCLLILMANAFATIRYVDSIGGENHFNTINEAYSAAVDGDTLLISEGIYAEDLESSKQLVIIGNGIDPGYQTRINGWIKLHSGSSGTIIEGVYVYESGTNTLVIDAAVSGVAIRRSWITTYNYSAILSNSLHDLEITDCIVSVQASNSARACLQLNGTAVEITNSLLYHHTANTAYAVRDQPESLILTNCIVLNFRTFANLSGAFPMLISNTIFCDWYNGTANWGSYPAGSTWEYNASTSSLPPGTNSIYLTLDPFVNYDEGDNYVPGTSDLHLDPVNGVPCIDTGSPAILDLDGSVSDLGLYGGLTPFIDTGAPNFPFVSGLVLPGAITVGDPLPIQSTGRIGREY